MIIVMLHLISKKTKLNYMEAHHLIPMDAQIEDRFSNVNLDCLENIVSLCSCCHNNIHYGIEPEPIIKKIYNERIDSLNKRGIYISFDELMKYYK